MLRAPFPRDLLAGDTKQLRVGLQKAGSDAESIVYTRGGDQEFSEKPYPHPAKIAEGAEQAVCCRLTGLQPDSRGAAGGLAKPATPSERYRSEQFCGKNTFLGNSRLIRGI